MDGLIDCLIHRQETHGHVIDADDYPSLPRGHLGSIARAARSGEVQGTQFELPVSYGTTHCCPRNGIWEGAMCLSKCFSP
jgi:hypothetical protein